jgi:hypothetical protein
MCNAVKGAKSAKPNLFFFSETFTQGKQKFIFDYLLGEKLTTQVKQVFQ